MPPHGGPDASLAFYRDTLGFEVRNDVEYGGLHWITVGPPGQPGTSIVLTPPAVDPGLTEHARRAAPPPRPPGAPGPSTVPPPPAVDPGIPDTERRVIAEMMAKGTFASINLATPDLDAAIAPRAGRAGAGRLGH